MTPVSFSFRHPYSIDVCIRMGLMYSGTRDVLNDRFGNIRMPMNGVNMMDLRK
jgi:hypothetical protein